jgi:hypothetical protein
MLMLMIAVAVLQSCQISDKRVHSRN